MHAFSSSAVIAAIGLVACGSLRASPGACRPCHSAIVDGFLKTGMGRSIQERPNLSPATFYHRPSNRHYTIAEGKIRRHQLDASQQPIQVLEKSVDFSIGSGNHAITYVHRTPQGRLLELPLSWYTEQAGYAMSPGYDKPDHFDMRREISPACLFCHSAYPKPGATATATPTSIDCERCHGSTEAHRKQPKRGNVLNPSKLPANRRLEVCLQCHLETVSRGIADSFRRPKRDVFSFIPGEPLGDYKLYFDRADAPEPRFEVNHAGYRMLQSPCYQKSEGKLTCTTCHDPHTAKARNACLDCHNAAEHPKSVAASSECVSCHMPKRRPSDAIHVTMTDHWIQRKPTFENPQREDHTPYNGPVVPFYTKSDSLTLAIANIGDLELQVIDLYRAQLKRDPKNVPTMAALGKALYRLNERNEAISVLKQALRLDPAHAGALNTLAVAYATQGDYRQAIALLDKARASDPDHSLTWVNLGVTYQAMGQVEPARNAYREAIRLQPDFSEARARLASLEAAAAADR